MKAVTPLDRASPTPLYHQLLSLLREQLESGVWRAGEAFPKEQELCEMYEVSRTTARAALNDLVRAGLLQRTRGKGTFVARGSSTERFIQSLGGFHREMSARGYAVSSTVLAQEAVSAPDDVAHALQIPIGTYVVHIARLRRLEGEPAVMGHAYFPYALCPDLLEIDLTSQSLYAYLEREYGFRPDRASRTVQARPLPAEVAGLLGVGEGACALYVAGVVRLADGTPLSREINWHRGDRTAFEVEVVTEEGGPE